jgi:hypothetical protein
MTRREAEKFMRSSCTGRRCISFLQDDRGRAIFKNASPFRSIGMAVSWFVSAIFVFLVSGCGTTPQKQTEKVAPEQGLQAQTDQAALQKS